MEISKKTDYALRMLAELVRTDDDVMSVRLVAEKNDVPYSFARSIQHDLVQAGIITSVRGSRGGMRLAADPHTTTVRQIIEAMQGPICVAGSDTASETEGPCRSGCGFDVIWCEAEKILRDYFDAVTLYDVVVEGRCPVLRHGHDFVALSRNERDELDGGTLERE